MTRQWLVDDSADGGFRWQRGGDDDDVDVDCDGDGEDDGHEYADGGLRWQRGGDGRGAVNGWGQRSVADQGPRGRHEGSSSTILAQKKDLYKYSRHETWGLIFLVF